MGVIEARRRILLTTPHPVTTTPAPVASFDTDMVGKLRSAKFAFSPVQSGSGDPSPTNVRPISGWTGLDVTRAGKNLFNPADLISGSYFNRSGGTINSNSYSRAYIRVMPGETVVYSGLVGANGNPCGIQLFDINKNFIQMNSAEVQSNNTAVTIPSGIAYIGISVFSSSNPTYYDVTTAQLELGSTATPYTPYTGSTYPVTWQSAGTIYGGYVDVCKGVVVAEWASYSGKWQDGDNESAIGETLKSRRFALGYIPTTGTANNICNIAPYSSGTSEIVKFSTRVSSGIGYASVTLPNDTTETTDIQIVSKLATPITYAITPTIIKTLRGANNLWSNANGDAEATYWTHKGGVIPDEYQRVEYLESSGTQYIQTDVPARSGVECVADVAWASLAVDVCILGGRKSNSDRVILIHQYSSGKWTFGYGSSYTNLGTIKANNKYRVEAKAVAGEQYLKVDGETLYQGTSSTEYTNNCSLALFACAYSDGAIRLKSSARVYTMTIKYNGVLAANFIPCIRKSDSKPGMYDTVTQTFYTNAGTGEFIVPA